MIGEFLLNILNDTFLPISELFRNVLNAGIQGSIVIGIVLLLRLVLKNAPKKYTCLLWILAGVRLLMPFSFESQLSLQPAEPVVSQQVWEDLRDLGEIFPPDAPTEAFEAFVLEPEEQPAVEKVPDPEITVTVKTEITPVMAAPYLWMAGMAALALYSLISYLRLKRRVREAVHFSDNIWECAGLDTAFILGLFRPRIYIPTGLGEDSGRYILDHERCHLERRDHWVKLIGFIALTVHWFNPLVWGAYTFLCRDMEMACDERVVQDMGLEERKRYSAALLECSANRAHWAACPVAFGEVSVKQRILGVLNYRKKSFWFSAVGIIAVIFVAVCFLTDPAEQQIPAGDNEWENEIRAVLEEIQSREHGYVIEQRHFEGEKVLNDSANFEFFRSGENWMTLMYIDDMAENGWTSYLGLGGDTFEAVSDGRRFNWQPTDLTEFPEPWLFSFDMDAQDAAAISRQSTDEGYELRLNVMASYNGLGESYHVNFSFDHDGNFRNAVLYASGMEESEYMTITTVMYAPESTEAEISRTMADFAATLDRDYDISLGTATLEEPDWNIRVTIADITPTGLTFKFTQTGELLGQQLFYGKDYFLDRWTGSGWEAVEPIVENWGFTLEALNLPEDTTTAIAIDWEWLYGELPDGTYRIGKDLFNRVEYVVGASGIMSPPGVEETNFTYYASFEIGEAVAADPTAALNRCEDALKAFQELESYIILTQLDIKEPASDYGTMTTQLFYKAGEDWESDRVTNTEGYYHLEKDGVQYERTVENVPESEGDSGWNVTKLEDENDYKPWLSTFQWDLAKIEFVQSSWPGRDVVSFTVHESPFDVRSHDLAERYSVTFCFVQGTNNLETVYLNYTAEPADAEGSFEVSASMTPKTGVDVAAQIDRLYTQEIARNEIGI